MAFLFDLYSTKETRLSLLPKEIFQLVVLRVCDWTSDGPTLFGEKHSPYNPETGEFFCDIAVNGNKEWYLFGKLGREGGLPAIERASGDKEWYVNGKLGREGGLPAVEYAWPGKEWYVNGKRHRDGGLPAIEDVNKDKLWYVNGELHREGGLPAVERANGTKHWYVNGKIY